MSGFNNTSGYNGNENLKLEGIKINWTPEQIQEYIKCAKDPIYFSEKYIKIVHVDHGVIPIKLYDFQKEIIQKATDNRNTIVLTGRQQGKCHSYDTKLTVRCVETGEIYEMEVGVFFEWQKFRKQVKEFLSTCLTSD